MKSKLQIATPAPFHARCQVRRLHQPRRMRVLLNVLKSDILYLCSKLGWSRCWRNPRMNYVLFLRIVGVKEMPADRLAATAVRLLEIVNAFITDGSQTISLSRVYGRIVLVPESARQSLEFAKK